MANVCIIPARGGSKRIPRKNIKEFLGKPLIAYSIETALKSKLFEDVIVSTEDEEIAAIAKKWGASVPFLRDKRLADDFSGTWDVIEWTLKELNKRGKKYDFCCTLYATAPLLKQKYLKEGFKRLKNSNASLSFGATSMPFPIQRTFKIVDGRCEMFWPENYTKRSQDLEEAYQDTGTFYWQNLSKPRPKIAFSKEAIPIIIPRYLVQDLDTQEDWERLEKLYKLNFPNRFDKWSELKQKLHKKEQKLHFRPRDVFMMSIGQNIGYEIFGKDNEYLRPVLVLKKFNNETFLGLPLTSQKKEGKYYFCFTLKGKHSTAILSQIRMFDIKRAKYFKGEISKSKFKALQKKVAAMIYPQVGGADLPKKEDHK